MRSLARSFVLVAAVASAAKKQKDDKIKITFTNKLDGPATLYVMGKKMHAFAAQGEKHSARSSDGQSWTAHDARGGEVFHYVVREKDGPDQRVDVSRGVSRRTIMSIVESEDHHLHRVDGGGDANVAGCADPSPGTYPAQGCQRPSRRACRQARGGRCHGGSRTAV